MQQVELIDRILSDENIKAAIHAVKSNKGAPGIDKMPVDALELYFTEHGEEIKAQIRAKKWNERKADRTKACEGSEGFRRPVSGDHILHHPSLSCAPLPCFLCPDQ